MAHRGALRPEFFSFQSCDLDHARAAVRTMYFPVALELRHPGTPYEYRFDAVRLGPVTAGEAWNRAGLRVRMPDLQSHYFVHFVEAGQMDSVHRGVPVTVTPRRAAVYRPVGESVVRFGDETLAYSVGIRRRALEAALEALLGEPVAAPLRLGPELDLASGHGYGWARLARLLTTEAGDPDGLLASPLVAAPLAEALLHGLLLAAPHPHRAALAAPAAASPAAVGRVVEAIHAQPEQPLTAAGLAALAGPGGGVAALTAGFRRDLGVAPLAYLRQVRLARAREELRRGESRTTTVAHIATRWGFPDVAAFGTSYTRRFGESPWDTLGRRPDTG